MDGQQEQIMRTRTTSTNVLNDIVRRAMGKKAERITRINNGVTNEVYCIGLSDGEFILRIAHGFDYDIFAIEQWAMQEVGRRGVPVPEVLTQGSIADNSELIYYQVQEKLSGEALDGSLASGRIDRDRAKRLTERAGKLLSVIHSVPTVGWGKIVKPNHGMYRSLKQQLLAFRDDSEKIDRALIPFSSLGVPRFEKIWHGLSYLEPFAVREPVLLHYDLTPDHVFVDTNDRITGVIDWGAVQSGDPVRDLVRWNYWNSYEFTIDWLASAYGRTLINSRNFDERMKLARTIDALNLLNQYTYNAPDRADAKKAALAIKDSLK